jgi:hypothetical protein
MIDTPPWEVGSWDLGADLEKIEQQWTAVHEILTDEALFALRATDVSAWSCGEQAGHILLVARATGRTIEQNLAEPERGRDGAITPAVARMLEAGAFPRGRARAPDGVDPSGRGRESFVALLPEVMSVWEGIAGREEEVRSCPARAHHFALGHLTGAEWVRFGAVHGAHHLAIVRDIRGV